MVALNSAPNTPEWLSNLGAVPMKYGLDLRGGVHFLMEVDTPAVISERLKAIEQEMIDVRQKYQNGQMLQDVYVAETRRLYDSAKAVKP